MRQVEQEAATTPKSAPQQAERLYPDVPQQPNFVPPFNGAVSPNNYPAIGHPHGQIPFAPFGVQVPPSALNADQQQGPFGRVLPPPPPRPMTAAERLQSQSFANGLGRRLLSMIGIGSSNSTEPRAAASSVDGSSGPANGNQMNEPLMALQNSTVLQQLGKGVHSIYGGLSRMYNNTVQEQLNLLQAGFKSELANSTNPWHRRMAEQVPQFFKQMVARVEGAQEQLNRVWHDVSQAAQGNSSIMSRSANANQQQQQQQQHSLFGHHFEHFLPGHNDGDFFHNIGHSLGFGSGGGANQAPAPQAQAQVMSGAQTATQPGPEVLVQRLRDFWHSQVQPQIGIIHNQVTRVWRDLTASGAYLPESMMRSRTMFTNQAGNSNTTNNNLLDDILKEADMNGAEYSLIEQPGGAANGNGESSS